MKTTREKYSKYGITFRISLILSMIVLIVLFYFFPRFSKMAPIGRENISVDLYVSDIPRTIQNSEKKPLPPRRPESGIPVPAEENELPPEIDIQNLQFSENSGEANTGQGVPVEVPAKPLLEFYPDVSGKSCKGYVRLLLLVGENGKIGSLEVIENTTGSKECLESASRAAKQSKWLPAKFKNKPVSSWVTKTYTFNLN